MIKEQLKFYVIIMKNTDFKSMQRDSYFSKGKKALSQHSIDGLIGLILYLHRE